jgi:hypothetical protein
MRELGVKSEIPVKGFGGRRADQSMAAVTSNDLLPDSGHENRQ